ncbi:hypothetical protein LOD99_400 [Oopsacas minuta]|uniref:Uncharacterized protein n=1 Tax=Oopsacas minuta TaxID=111878 RepID=A0AAV7K997_9METZ|nr:hypothetical protein LOD99_400 [Oopsacas minuta]
MSLLLIGSTVSENHAIGRFSKRIVSGRSPGAEVWKEIIPLSRNIASHSLLTGATVSNVTTLIDRRSVNLLCLNLCPVMRGIDRRIALTEENSASNVTDSLLRFTTFKNSNCSGLTSVFNFSIISQLDTDIADSFISGRVTTMFNLVRGLRNSWSLELTRISSVSESVGIIWGCCTSLGTPRAMAMGGVRTGSGNAVLICMS